MVSSDYLTWPVRLELSVGVSARRVMDGVGKACKDAMALHYGGMIYLQRGDSLSAGWELPYRLIAQAMTQRLDLLSESESVNLRNLARSINGHTEREMVRLVKSYSASDGGQSALTDSWAAATKDRIKAEVARTEAEALDAIRAAARDGLSLKRAIAKVADVFNRRAASLGVAGRNMAVAHASELYAAKMQGAGIERYIWITMRDNRVRKSHRERDGNVYAVGVHPMPGEEINCRCYMRPIA